MTLLGLPIVMMLGYISCRKVDFKNGTLSDSNRPILSIESKFFTSYRSTDPVEKIIVDFIGRQNSKTHFVEKVVNQIGFPRWNKMMKQGNLFNSVSKVTVSSVGDNGSSKTPDVYYIPFVRDSQNFVNASLVVKISPTDTTMNYLCDWQYTNKVHGSPSVDTTAESYALFFMLLDHHTLGNTQYDLIDTSLFPKAISHFGKKTFGFVNKSNPSATGNIARSLADDLCVDIYVCGAPDWCADHGGCDYLNCIAYPGTPGYCYLVGSICGSDADATISDGGSPSGISGGNSSSGGGGSGGSSSTPPSPCDNLVNQPVQYPASAQNPVSSQNKTTSSAQPCNSSPGWTPITGPVLINSAPQLVADEQEPGASDNDPNNIWWNDNSYDPNTNYPKQTRPKWADVYKNYPKDQNGNDLPLPNVCALIGGEVVSMYNNGNISNACALRVSRALNLSGINIPNIKGQTKQGSDGKNYFLLASQLYNFLLHTFDKPEIHKSAADGAPNGTKFQNLLMGIQNRGIYIMRPISESSFLATGHATLWGGLDCIGSHNYFAAASDIYIWILPQ
jgi:hypothetical protein